MSDSIKKNSGCILSLKSNQHFPVPVERLRLDNGLTILLCCYHTVPIVTSMIWYGVGSRLERPGLTGISHFLEHMMFKGTRHFGKGEIDYLTARHGGTNNAFTSLDYTAYYFSFASDRWEIALEMEADRMANSCFEEQEFELERQVIVEELKMDLDTPWGALRHSVETQAFDSHPYRLPVLGFSEDLHALSLQDLDAHYRRYYTPDNATLVLVGDFSRDRAVGKVEDLFGRMDSRPFKSAPDTAAEWPREPKDLEVQMPSQIGRLLVALPAPSVLDERHYAIQILDSVLSGGKLSRLYDRLVERDRTCSMIDTDIAETRDPYLFQIRAELLQGARYKSVLTSIREELTRLSEELVSSAEMERARNHCIVSCLGDFETTLDRAVQLGLLETIDRFEYWYSYDQKIQDVDATQVRDVAATYLSLDQATVGRLVNGSA